MKTRLAWLIALFASSLFGQGDSATLAAYLNELRHMNPVQREAAFDSTEFQKTAAHRREIEETVFKPLLTGDLALYIDTLKAGMNDADPYIKQYTASLVSLIATNPEVYLVPNSARVRALATLVPSLIALTDEIESDDVRTTALGSLARIVSTGDPSITVTFKKALNDKDARVRGAGLFGLAWVPQEQSVVLEEALRFLRSDPDLSNRKLAASILSEIAINDSRILSALITSINDPSAEVQQVAVSALYERGHGNKAVLQVLEKKLAQPGLDQSVRLQIEREMKVQEQ